MAWVWEDVGAGTSVVVDEVKDVVSGDDALGVAMLVELRIDLAQLSSMSFCWEERSRSRSREVQLWFNAGRYEWSVAHLSNCSPAATRDAKLIYAPGEGRKG